MRLEQILKNLISKINGFIEQVDDLYITVDLDVFSASIAPGVSAPAVKGIDLSVFDPLLEAIKKTGKIKVFDVRGRLLEELMDLNATETNISCGSANEMLLIQVISQDDVSVIKKVVR